MITYNHEKYIAQALESILMQKVNFNFEIVVGEDFSTDNTRKILLDYSSKYPRIFKLILQKSNIGGQKNAIDTLAACTGKYIATCEGDDYWTDEHKLQKQVDFLEANPDFSAIGHQTIVKVEDEQKKKEKFYNYNSNEDILFYKGKKDVLSFRDFIHSYYIHINSILYRSCILKIYDLKDVPLNDHAQILLIASKGEIKVLPDIMSVYRRHSTGASAQINPNKAFEAQKKWVSDLYKIIKYKFIFGYHYQLSNINVEYALRYSVEINIGKCRLIYNYLKNFFLTLILFPRNIKTKFRELKKVLKYVLN
jgi:glycosyltransferase involved in cell wall biosynthesis